MDVNHSEFLLLRCPYLASDEISHLHGNLVMPRECHELVPPPLDYLRHVESSEEFNWHHVLKLATVDAENLKVFSPQRMVPQNVPINGFTYVCLHK